ncbi:unnamed protein product, partial [Rotaria sp. Silwood1]
MFAFVLKVPNRQPWHANKLDHTMDGKNGYMFLVNVGNSGSSLFDSKISNLCIGRRYEFSAYLANVRKPSPKSAKPNVRFEVRTTAANKHIIATKNTGDIVETNEMTWLKYGLSFVAKNSSVVLLMISNVKSTSGNNLAIDDIELRVCPAIQPNLCPQ